MGTRLAINPDNLILDPSQPIASLQFPVENNRIAQHLRESLINLARQFKFDGRIPFEKLPTKSRHIFLWQWRCSGRQQERPRRNCRFPRRWQMA